LLFREPARLHVHPLTGDGLYPFLEEVWGLRSVCVKVLAMNGISLYRKCHHILPYILSVGAKFLNKSRIQNNLVIFGSSRFSRSVG
jgi:hypothetical protein